MREASAHERGFSLSTFAGHAASVRLLAVGDLCAAFSPVATWPILYLERQQVSR